MALSYKGFRDILAKLSTLVPILNKIWRSINCHQFILFVAKELKYYKELNLKEYPLSEIVKNIQQRLETVANLEVNDKYGIKGIMCMMMDKPWEDMIKPDNVHQELSKTLNRKSGIVFVSIFGKMQDGSIYPIHSYMVLGQDKNKRFIAFHKAGSGEYSESYFYIDISDYIMRGYINVSRNDGFTDIRVAIRLFTMQ